MDPPAAKRVKLDATVPSNQSWASQPVEAQASAGVVNMRPVTQSGRQSRACQPVEPRVAAGNMGAVTSGYHSQTRRSDDRRSGLPTQAGANWKTAEPRKLRGSKVRIAIAISGPPTSGKTTLAYLLAAVFEGVTLSDTGFAGAQSMYPLFDARVEDDPDKKGSIAKVVIVHQSDYRKPVGEWPRTNWSEVTPYSPAIDALHPEGGVARALAELRGRRTHEHYWQEAFKANIDIDPSLLLKSSKSRFRVSNSSKSLFEPSGLPRPVRISKEGPHYCRGAFLWAEFGIAINEGLLGHGNQKGTLETVEGRDKIAEYLLDTDPNTGVRLVTSADLEPLRERVRQWIRNETNANGLIDFPGRVCIDGKLKELVILDGSHLFLQTLSSKAVGGEKFMKACDVKLFLPALEQEGIRRHFNRGQYMNARGGTKTEEETLMSKGYFSEVVWKDYKSEHAWIFENGNATNQIIKASPAAHYFGLHVRQFFAAHLELPGHKLHGKNWADATLDWAIRVILARLSLEEAQARLAFLEAQKNDAAEGEDLVMESVEGM